MPRSHLHPEEPDETAPGCESYRYAGLVLQVNMIYDNRFSFDTGSVQFRYTVDRVEEAEFKGYNTIYTDPGNYGARVVENRHGIRMVFEQVSPAALSVLLISRHNSRLCRSPFLVSSCGLGCFLTAGLCVHAWSVRLADG